MKAFTTIEESKQLIEAGLDVNTADMLYSSIGYYNKPFVWTSNPYMHPKDIPCWSLAALLNIIDKNNLIYNISNEKIRDFAILVYRSGHIKQKLKFYHLEHNIIDMIIWLLKNNYIKPNKNETNMQQC